MTTKTAIVRARVNPGIKVGAENILNKLGLTVSDAINLLLIQIKMKKGLPFDIRIPNVETRKVLEESEKGIGLNKCKDIDDLYHQLGL